MPEKEYPSYVDRKTRALTLVKSFYADTSS